MPRRKPGTLLPLEIEILVAALSMRTGKTGSFHGFGIAQVLHEEGETRTLTSHGTLYKALGRLERQDLLASRWEDAAAVEGRPRRRLYELTGQGVRVAERALADRAAKSAKPSPRVAPEPA